MNTGTLPRILVTGKSGFVGGHFTRCVAGRAVVAGLTDPSGREVDVRDAVGVEQAVSAIRPDAVLHLAAQSFVPESFRDPVGTFQVNLMGTLNLLVALERAGFRGRFLLVSSGDTYGQVDPAQLPIIESHPQRPRSPYAASKVAAEALCFQWSQAQTVFPCLSVRAFNHIGPGQSPRFAVSDFAQQIVAIKAGRRAPVLEVGDIDATRDFTDVRDVVEAYARLLERGRNGMVYNVCSGQERSLRELIERMLAIAGVRAEIRQDPARLRPGEQRRVVGDHGLIHADTGWTPAIPLERTLRDLLEHWQGSP